MFFCGSERADFDGPVAAAEGGDGIILRSGTGEFVGGAAVEMELNLAEGRLGNYNRTFRESDLGTAFRAGFGEEDAVPSRAAGGEVVDVEDHARETLVEDARLDGERELGGNEGRFESASGAKRERGEPKSHEESEGGAEDSQYADGEENALAAEAEGAKSDDFTVHGHTAEAEEHTDEDGHGEGENEDAGKDAKKKSGDLGSGARVADEDLHEADELGNKEDEGEDQKAKERVASDFAGDVAIEDAHREKGECNMGSEARKQGGKEPEDGSAKEKEWKSGRAEVD